MAAMVVIGLVGWGTPTPVGAADRSNARAGVLPASAKPLGYSLTDMTGLLALFTTSGNDPAYYPDTPFQILYVDPQLSEPFRFVARDLTTPCDSPEPPCGLLATQSGPYSNTFNVPPGTKFFVPVDNADDSPLVVGTFPVNNREARNYIFDPEQVGGEDFAITIDGVSTQLGPRYVAGPVTTPPLLDGGGTHIVTIGAFLAPMKPGQHTVRITGGYFGQAITDTYGIGFIALDFTYRVTVTA